MILRCRPRARAVATMAAALVAAFLASIGEAGFGADTAGAAPESCAAMASTALSGDAIPVVVEGSGGTAAVCVTIAAGSTGIDALYARAALLGTSPPRFDPRSGLLCAIDGYPATGCGERTAGGYAYWSYWWGDGGSWVYANQGPGSRRVKSGRVEGWRFQTGSGAAVDLPPQTPATTSVCDVAPPSTAPVTTTTAPAPTTAPPSIAPPSGGGSGYQPPTPTAWVPRGGNSPTGAVATTAVPGVWNPAPEDAGAPSASTDGAAGSTTTLPAPTATTTSEAKRPAERAKTRTPEPRTANVTSERASRSEATAIGDGSAPPSAAATAGDSPSSGATDTVAAVTVMGLIGVAIWRRRRRDAFGRIEP